MTKLVGMKKSVRNLGFLVLLAVFCLAMAWAEVSWAQLTKAQEEYKKGERFHHGEGVDQDVEMALRYYKRSLDMDPDLFHALLNSGMIYYNQQKYKHATNFFARSVKVARKAGARENEGLARSNLGASYQKDGETGKAEKQFRAALKMDDSLVEAYYNFINLLISEERLAEANIVLKKAEELAPSSRYQKFKGKIKSVKSQGMLGDTELGIVIIGFLMGLLFYLFYLKVKAR